MANLPSAVQRPLNSLETLGGQLAFYVGVVVAIPRSIKRYPRRSCGSWPRSPSAAAPSPSSVAPSASSSA